MRTYIVMSHSHMARGVVDSIKMLAGEQTQIDYLCGYVDGNENIEQAVRAKLDAIEPNQEIVVFTDLFGGSVNNAVLQAVKGAEGIHVVAGMNLALILGILFAPEEADTQTLIHNSIAEARKGILYCNDLAVEDGVLEEF
ncbi:MAG: PTS fructose IIA subunit [Lachnospiraceae bacterium]|jgi:fructoselysine and glucoselysine-specific PTS system IIA component|nr:PTS fructose IIA subunit [Lachnospiraceae bacterium]MCI9622628.1 PTS fructose IIA subunit [Lachnospiraceae bacterium]